MNVRRSIARLISGSIATIALAFALTACGAGSTNTASASAAATPTCGPTLAFKSVTGTIQAVAGNTVTVSAADGTRTQVTISASTHITQLVAVKPSALTSGTRVQVTTDAAATTAQRILVTPQGAGTGTGGFRGAGASRTPTGRFNPACLRQQSQGQGQGQARGQQFAGLAGTVESATSTQLVLDDAQSQTFTLAITPTTIIETSAAGKASDLTTGAKVLITGTSAAGGITARNITIES